MRGEHDFWMDRLSALLDGDLPPREAEALEEHLAGCPPCRGARDDLAEIRLRARALSGIHPPRALWDGIRARLGDAPLEDKVIPLSAAPASRGRRARVLRLGVPQAVAAALVLVGGGWMSGALLTPGGRDALVPVGGGLAGVPAQTVLRSASQGDLAGSLSGELEELERTVIERAETLDEETRRTLLRSLETIDRAIRESADALSRDPGSEYLQGHLGSAVERKRGYLLQMAQLLEA